MIRTILVDDEHIVRKGLVHILPWEKHGMELTGDFPSGEKALEWMIREPVDLLVTDLSMPGMSGFDLILRAKEKFPDTRVVILTCHQDFQYIQDALRLGAIDYIVKTELDDDKLDSIFGRIEEKMKSYKAAAASPAAVGASAHAAVGALFIGLVPDCTVNELLSFPWVAEERPISLDNRACYTEISSGNVQLDGENHSHTEGLHRLEGRWALAFLHHANSVERSRLRGMLGSFLNRHAFYEFKDLGSGPAVTHTSFRDLLRYEKLAPGNEWQSLWNSYEWLHRKAAFDELIDHITGNRPDPYLLLSVMEESIRTWSYTERLFFMKDSLEQFSRLRTWTEWHKVLTDLRLAMHNSLYEAGISMDMAKRILQAIDWSRQHLGEGVTQEEIAGNVYLSRGYFSDNFKRISGISFHDFMRKLRIDKARLLLKSEDVPFQEVAERCGFADEAYFRKLFRAETGLSPRDYSEHFKRLPRHKGWPYNSGCQ